MQRKKVVELLMIGTQVNISRVRKGENCFRFFLENGKLNHYENKGIGFSGILDLVVMTICFFVR